MKLSQVAIQFYTLRDFCKTTADYAVTCKKVREIGYTAIQLSGIGPIPEAELRSIAHGEGLTICATHENGAKILDETDAVIARLHALDTKLTAYPYPAGIDFNDPAHVDTLIKKLEIAGAKMRAAGLGLGYHNHAHEFYRPAGGPTILESIYARTSPENVLAELDTFWVQRGGGDVVEWVKRVKGRTPFIHLKDYKVNPSGEPSLCEIGAGTLDFKRIIAEAEAGGCQWFIVEQDHCPGDPFVSIKQSYDYIKAHLVG
ncbi:MAG: sugar phosphate isomerase/epimerase [Opitutaceae bacterium]|jgi:sugar phosphate isomerase/epimerase|nr:sugar phosphate isomerase/epimerase [Opitutaceae bacterium]